MIAVEQPRVTDETKLSELTVGDLKTIVRGVVQDIVQQAVFELEQQLLDPDEGLEFRPEIKERMQNFLRERPQGISAENVMQEVSKEYQMRNVIIYLDEDGHGYTADCPSLPGCHSQGDTWEEVIANIKEAIDTWIEDAQARNEHVPDESDVWLERV